MRKGLFGRHVRRWVLLIACCLAVFAGVVYARWVPLADARWLFVAVPFVALSLRRQNIVTVFLLAVMFFGVGWWRGSVQTRQLAVHDALQYQKVVLVGRAADDAVYGKRYQLEFPMDHVTVVSPVKAPLVGGVSAGGFGESAVYRGDMVRVEGKLYPALGNTLARVSYGNLTVLERDTFWLNKLRREFSSGMQSALPEPVASFGLGLLIGQRNTLPQTASDQLRAVGLTHIIAVSGYNLTIIVMAARRLLAKRSKFQTTAVALALIGLFLLVTGFSPPIVRAALVSILSLGAWYYGRTVQPMVLLFVAAAITVIANPLYLWGNVSWYLSFLAFFGVLAVSPLITKRLLGGKEPNVLLGILIESISASVLVVPYVLFIFGQISLVSLPANVLVVPFIPLAMLLSLVAGLAGMFIPAVAGYLAWPAMWLMTYMLDTAHLLSRVPHAFLSGIGVSWRQMLVMYGVIGFVCLILWGKTKVKRDIITEKIQSAREGV